MPSSASATNPRSTLSLHDALPISPRARSRSSRARCTRCANRRRARTRAALGHSPPRPPPDRRTAAHARRARGGSPRSRSHRDDLRRSEEHTSELQSPCNLVCRLLLRLPTLAPLFPYTTLFRSLREREAVAHARVARVARIAGALVREQRLGIALRVPRRIAELPRTRGAHAVDLRDRDRIETIFEDRKSTRLNSSHLVISYAVFCFGYQPSLHSFPTRRSSDLSASAKP